MNPSRPSCCVVLGTVAMMAAGGLAPPASAPLRSPAAERPAEDLAGIAEGSLTPFAVSVTRTRPLAADGAAAVEFPPEPIRAGLFLDLHAKLEPKRNLLRATVVSLGAGDSTRQDLVEDVLARRPGRPLEAIAAAAWVASRDTLRLWVGTPDPAAETIDIALVVQADTYSGVEKLPLPRTDAWRPLDHAALGERNVEYRFFRVGSSEFVQFRPPATAEVIYRVDPRSTPRGLTASPSMTDHDSVSYLLNPVPGEEPSLTVCTAFERRELSFAADGIPLPR